MVEPQAAQDRGIEIVDVHRIADDVVAIIVGLAVLDAAANAGPREPHAEATAVMVPAMIVRGELALAVDRPAKLAAPDHQRVF